MLTHSKIMHIIILQEIYAVFRLIFIGHHERTVSKKHASYKINNDNKSIFIVVRYNFLK